MEYTALGPTGVKVSKISVGTATFGVAPREHDADRVVRAALDLGINFFDTANVYGNQPTFDRPASRPPPNASPRSGSWAGRSLDGGTMW